MALENGELAAAVISRHVGTEKRVGISTFGQVLLRLYRERFNGRLRGVQLVAECGLRTGPCRCCHSHRRRKRAFTRELALATRGYGPTLYEERPFECSERSVRVL